MTYEQFIMPALWALPLAAALVLLARGFLLGRTRKTKALAAGMYRKAAYVVVAALIAVPAVAIIPAGHRGVVYSAAGGVSLDERGEGITVLVPWVQHLTPMSVRTQKLYSDQVYAQSKDLQEITVVASVNYHVDATQAADLYRNVGSDYQTTVIQPALFQRVKAAVGQVLAVDFAEDRARLAETIQAQLETQLDSYGIIVEYVNIEDAIFDPAFITAVKDKVIADEIASKERRLVSAEKAKKEQAILQAEARAEAVRIEAIAQSEANELLARTLTEALLQWRLLTTWDGVLPTTLVGGGDGISFLIDGRGTIKGG